MARRAGKAASRKARQRKGPPKRPIPPAPAQTTAGGPGAAATSASSAVESVAASEPRRASAPSPRRAQRPSLLATGSSLTDSERSEYHYVERDLRNIGILTAIMIGLLLVAWLIFTATGHVA